MKQMLLEKIKHTIKKYDLLNKNDKVLIGVSGGPDSVVLLATLHTLSRELGFSIHVAHLDHMIRKDSAKDRDFVERLCGKMGVAVSATQVNVKELAKRGSLEEIARNARLGFLFNVAKRIKANKIALGHTRDDQAETVLMRIIRGSGLYGLSGILPKRELAGYCIIRPLIESTRKEIEAFLKNKKLRFCVDITNKEDVYFRNKVRNTLLPLLEKEYNRNIKEILSNTALTVGYDYDYLTKAAAKITARWGKRINLTRFTRLHPAMQSLVLRLSIARVRGDMRRISFAHLDEINDLIYNRPVNSIVDLPKGVSVVKKKASISFYLRSQYLL
jgi:tRNA(Ile)-lysidine synthase